MRNLFHFIIYFAFSVHGHFHHSPHDHDHHDHDHHHHHHMASNHNHNDRELKDKSRTCGFQEPNSEELRQIENDIKRFKEEGRMKKYKSQTIEIDVYFHIFTSTSGVGAIPEATVLKQIDILNDAYSGVPSSYSECGFTYDSQTVTPFHFNLVHLETIVDDNAFNLDSGASDTIRAGLRKGDCSDLNIFTGQMSLHLGKAYLPIVCPSNGNPAVVGNRLDSSLLLYSTLPEMGATLFDEGDTATHEVGHWLGLFHTFQGGCDDGDLVEDTPAESSLAFGCPIGRDTCSSSGVDPIHNYMDYTYDCCKYTFTEGQNERMIAQAALYRGLVPVDIVPTTSPAPSEYTTPSPSAQPTISIAPSSAPTSCEGDYLSITIITDDYPIETRWTLADDCNDIILEEIEYGFYSTTGTSYEHTLCSTESGLVYVFTIFDSFSDGICCSSGSGSYSVTLNGQEVASGGDFGSSEVTIFAGSTCAPSTKPSNFPSISPAPSTLPSASPTSASSEFPTIFSSSEPSQGPSKIPSEVPTSEPTEVPTSDPTENPLCILNLSSLIGNVLKYFS